MSKSVKKQLEPSLRFPEFKNDTEWDNPSLSEIANRIEEKVGERKLTTVSISAGIGFVSQVEKFSRDISGQQYKNYIFIKAGDFSYNKGNSKKYPQGCIYKLKEYGEAAAPNAFVNFRFKSKVVPEFYEGYFESNFHGPQLQKFISSGARMDGLLNISQTDFFTIKFPTPKDKKEQQKIADCLSSLDELITAENQKLETLQLHKKGLMQQLFPAEGEKVPKLRFKEFRDCGDWEILPLGEKIELMSGFPFSGFDIIENPTGVPLMRGINITEGYIRHNSDIDRFYLGKLDGLEKYSLKKDDLVIGMDGSKVGKNSSLINDKDTGALLVQRVARLRAKKRVSIQFIFQIINSAIFHFYVNRINTSSGIPHISAKQIEDFQIFFPSYEEQCKVAFSLRSVDDLISSVSQRIDSLKAHKKGLMQQLFPNVNASE